MVSFWCQNVTVHWRRFSAREEGHFTCVLPLFYSFYLSQFCSPPFSFVRFAHSFVESDQIMHSI